MEQLNYDIFSTITQYMDDALLVVDEDLRIVLANRRFCEFLKLKLTSQELTGMSLKQLFLMEDTRIAAPGLTFDHFQSITQLTDSVVGEEFQIDTDNYFRRDYVPILKDGVFKGFYWRCWDINELKQKYLNAELEKLDLLGKVSQKTKNLKESEDKFRIVVDHIKEVIYQVDLNGSIVYLNNSWEELTDFAVSESVGCHTLDFIYKEDIAKAEAMMRDTLGGYCDQCKSEMRFVTRRGHIPWFEVFARPFYDEEGQIIGAYGTLRDITEQKMIGQLEKELLDMSVQVAVTPYENIPEAINLALGRMGKFLDADRSYIFEYDELTGIVNNTYEWCYEGVEPQIQELQGVPIEAIPIWMEHLHANKEIIIPSVADLPPSWDAVRAILEPQSVQSLLVIPMYIDRKLFGFLGLDIVRHTKDFLQTEINILRMWGNMITGLIAKKNKETQFYLSEAKFSRAFQSNSVLMCIFRVSDYQILDVNNAFLQTLYFDKEEVFGKDIVELELLPAEMTENLSEIIKSGVFPVSDKELELRNHKGEEVIMLFSADVIYVGDDQCLLTTMVDISNRKKTELELQQAKISADKANKAKSDFLSRMSHELRTPMNSILGFAQLLEMGELTPMQRKGITHILNSGKHLLHLINEVLDISRIEAGKMKIVLEKINLQTIVQQSVELIQPLASKSGIAILTKDLLHESVFVSADKQKLIQVLVNLLNNAIKFNRPKGTVTITLAVDRSGIMISKALISVEDSGYGISPENLIRLFEPFERFETEFINAEGTGLGLPISRELTEAMGGEIKVSSELGVGSRFTLELPLVDDQITDQQIESMQKIQYNINSEIRGRVLYIEDNVLNTELVRELYEMHRPQIEMWSEVLGEKATHTAEQAVPNLILLDLNLPDIHGSSVFNLLKRNQKLKDIPVVVISADAMPQQIESLKKMGVRDYLTKPVDVNKLLELTDMFLNLK